MISKHPLADCANCPLATQPYYSQPLNEDAAVVFVGSGPVINEGFKGGFLYGADAGKLIRSVCNVHNIPIENVTYTTAVKCAGFADLKLSEKRKAMAACNPAMFDDLDKVDPDAVVTLGGEAYTATTGVRSSVSNARVGPAKYSDATQTMVVPTVSPWACLQTESQFQFLVTDIGKLVNKAPEFTPPVYDVIYTEHEGRSVLTGWINEAEAIDEQQPLVLDIEVAMEKDISFEHPSRYDMLCIGVKYGDHTITVFTEDSLSPEFWELFRLLCDNSEVVAHNGKFDLSGLRHLCGKINLNFDTMLAHYVLDERSGIHGLKYLAQEYLGAPAYDDEITAIMGKSKDFGTIPKDTLYKYNAYDVHCTALLHTMFKKRLQDDKLQHVHDFLIKVSNMLQDVEHVGMAIDRKYLGELDYEYVNKMDSQIEALKDFVGPDFNPRSYQQVKKFLLDCGIEVASTAANVLEGVVSRIEELFEENRGNLPAKVRIGYGMLTTLLEYRKDQKLYGTYVEGTKNRLYRGKVHPTYLIHGTTTGRLSARNPNCVDGETEVLTPEGFVRISDLTEEDLIYQVSTEGFGNFVKPKLVKYKHTGKMVNVDAEWGHFKFTPDHRMLVFNRRNGMHKFIPASDWLKYQDEPTIIDYKVLRGTLRTDGRRLNKEQLEELRMAVMVQADGSYTPYGFYVAVKSRRKKQQLEELAGEYIISRGELYRAKIPHHVVSEWLSIDHDREFLPQILSIDKESLDVFVDEVFKWDGDFTRHCTYAQKWTKQYSVDIVQAALAMTGNSTTQYEHPNNELVVVNTNPNMKRYQSRTEVYLEEWDDYVYCVEVPTTAFLIRRGGSILVTGNCQNISSDKKIKRLFIPSAEDRSLVHADYSQAELRYLSYFAKDTYFRDIFNDGSRDLFDELIVEIFPGSIKELESPADWKHKRRVVKTVVYGLNYGRTEYGIAQGLDIPVDEALKIKNRFFSTIPEIIGWQEEIKEAVRRGDDLVTPFGRHRRYSLITKQNEKKVMNEALAFMPQSTASDGTVQAAVLVNKEFNAVWGRDPKRPHIINLVHDDIIVDASDDDAEEVGEILSRNMIEVAERCVNGYVKFDVAANAGKSWDELL